MYVRTCPAMFYYCGNILVPIVSFVEASQTVEEGERDVFVTVTRKGDSSKYESSVTVVCEEPTPNELPSGVSPVG